MKTVLPVEKFEGEFLLPGDKSITHRAIMFNGAAEGQATITGGLLGEDCLSTCECMRALGAEVEVVDGTIFVKGNPNFQSGASLNCGNSGTTIRLLSGLCAGKGIEATLYGDSSLSTRPMGRVAEPLSTLGANIVTTEGKPPVSVFPAALKGGYIKTKVASAQVKSAILLAGISAEGATTVEEPVKSRDHTERLLKAMGANIVVEGNTVTVQKSKLKAVDVCVPVDISSAAYFMAIGALKGKTLCKNVGINPTRTGILTAFDKMGIKYQLQDVRTSGGEEIADILVEKSKISPVQLGGDEIPSMIDELPLVAMLCAFADGESVITDAKELRVKESDRIYTTAKMIRDMGGECEELEDGLRIVGKGYLRGGDVDSFMDHRIAMTATVGLKASREGGEVLRPDCCAISFPTFYQEMDKGE